eukprot:IDg2244t1
MRQYNNPSLDAESAHNIDCTLLYTQRCNTRAFAVCVAFEHSHREYCIGVDAREECTVFDTVDKIIGEPLLFDALAGGNRMYTDFFVQRLSVDVLAYG